MIVKTFNTDLFQFNDPGVSDESLDAEHHQSRRKTQDGESESSSSSNGRLSRNERLVMDMKIPMTVREIIQNPIEEFNDLLTSKDITEEKINICRDIRRRGKNKVRTYFFNICVITTSRITNGVKSIEKKKKI